MSFNIFVSYSSNDKYEIELLLGQLSTINDTKIFFADWSINPGDEIYQKILYNIENSDIFLVFYSESAIASNYVQQEIGIAKSNDKLIIPILLDSSKPTGMLEGINYLNFHNQTKKQIEVQKLYDYILNKVENKKKLNDILIILAILALGYLLVKTIKDKHFEKIENGFETEALSTNTEKLLTN